MERRDQLVRLIRSGWQRTGRCRPSSQLIDQPVFHSAYANASSAFSAFDDSKVLGVLPSDIDPPAGHVPVIYPKLLNSPTYQVFTFVPSVRPPFCTALPLFLVAAPPMRHRRLIGRRIGPRLAPTRHARRTSSRRDDASGGGIQMAVPQYRMGQMGADTFRDPDLTRACGCVRGGADVVRAEVAKDGRQEPWCQGRRGALLTVSA